MNVKNENGVLSYDELIKRLNFEDEKFKLYITPLLNPSEQIGYDSIDIRLGTEFIIFKSFGFSQIDPIKTDLRENIGEYQSKTSISIGKPLFLHPRQFVLGISLEYVKLPSDIMAYVTGRSSWSRLGLVIAAATAIHSKYSGVITLELGNIGEAPIALYPGMRVAQLIFHKTNSSTVKKPSKYFMSVSPTFTKVCDEPEINIIKKMIEHK